MTADTSVLPENSRKKLAHNVKELARQRYFTAGRGGAHTAFDYKECQNQQKKVVPCCHCKKVGKYQTHFFENAYVLLLRND